MGSSVPAEDGAFGGSEAAGLKSSRRFRPVIIFCSALRVDQSGSLDFDTRWDAGEVTRTTCAVTAELLRAIYFL